MKPKLEVTNNYNMFQMHELNRDLSKKKILENSMKKYGFMPSCPIHCIKNGSNKLKVIRGHHRLHFAKRLKLPVYYIVDNSNSDIYQLEGDSTHSWSAKDFVKSYAKSGNRDYMKLSLFQRSYGIPINAAASILSDGRNKEDSGGISRKLKSGNFKIMTEEHAKEVMFYSELAYDSGLIFAKSTAFIMALSLVLKIPELNRSNLKYKIKTYSPSIRKRSSVMEYLEEIEHVYNHGQHKNRIPIKFMVQELGRKRA